LYNAAMTMQGRFAMPDFTQWDIHADEVLLGEAFLSIGVTDMRGIKDNISIKWDDISKAMEPGVEHADMLQSGINAKIPLSDTDVKNKIHSFSLALNINGSGQLDFLPLGKRTDIRLSSAWSSPSFEGAFLPEEREISASGFTAHWKILHLNRNYPQQWTGNGYDVGPSAFGVNLLLPVNEYQKIMRTTKYAILFIALTFLAFYMIEIMSQRLVHAIQYLLVGFALCLFYALLLSLSEHLAFGLAYAIAAAACTVCIAGYARAVLHSIRLSALVSGLISVLYGFLYVVLQQEDYALLMGSIGLFIVLAGLMFITRKIDWYALGAGK
jgi:inner membrane protein